MTLGEVRKLSEKCHHKIESKHGVIKKRIFLEEIWNML
jgi:hypothetical protein